ncbi:MAG: hypothetical protein WCC66_01790 [Rhizobiaceae bacterium]
MGFALYLIVIGAFFVLLLRFRRSSVIFPLTIAAWIGAFAWNAWILSTCPGDCNIRVDLVLIAPLVLIATVFSLIEALRRWRGIS